MYTLKEIEIGLRDLGRILPFFSFFRSVFGHHTGNRRRRCTSSHGMAWLDDQQTRSNQPKTATTTMMMMFTNLERFRITQKRTVVVAAVHFMFFFRNWFLFGLPVVIFIIFVLVCYFSKPKIFKSISVRIIIIASSQSSSSPSPSCGPSLLDLRRAPLPVITARWRSWRLG